MINGRYLLIAGLAIVLSNMSSSAQLDGSGIAPDFTLTDLDGEQHHLYSYLDQNKVVVIDFFAVWCSICKADAEYLNGVYKEFGPEGNDRIVMLSLEADDATTDSQAREFAEEFGGGNPHINETGTVPLDYRQNYYPTYYVIAPDRSYYLIGGRQESMQQFMEEAILAAPPLRTVENDVRMMEFYGPQGSVCSDMLYPTIRIQNYGSNAIQEFTVETLVDGRVDSSYPFVGQLNPYHFADLRLPWLVNLSPGWHTIDFRFTRVNGEPDGDPDNGFNGSDFLILPDGEELTVSITTDPYPKETYWRIYQDHRVVAVKSDYTRGLETENTAVCVEHNVCYRLVLYDTYGDGMSSGGVELYYNQEKIAEISALEFSGDSVSTTFCTRSLSAQTTIFSETEKLNIYPNPGNGYLTLNYTETGDQPALATVMDQNGKILRQIRLYPGATVQEDLSDLPDGVYLIRMVTKTSAYVQKWVLRK